jgi:hypothetical protein
MSVINMSLKNIIESIRGDINFIDSESNNIPIIENIGKRIINKYPEIKNIRKIFTFDFDVLSQKSDDHIKNFIEENLNIKNYKNIEIIRKQIKNDGLSPHFDNYKIYYGKILQEEKDKFIELTKDKKYITITKL